MEIQLEPLFDAIEKRDLSAFSSVLFTLYEDQTGFSIEACLDEEALVLGREDPYVICGDGPSWKRVNKAVGGALSKHIKSHSSIYSHFDTIAYGFADGDLNYIRKPSKKKETVRLASAKKEPVHFTAEDFEDFAPAKLKAWLTIYLTAEANEKSWKEWFALKFETLSEEQLRYWREFLASHFDYEKYRSNK